MNIAITGHTSGIGLALYNKFIEENYNVLGFSKKTGHDISLESTRQSILDQIQNCDIFVNNAWHITGQLELLKEVMCLWDGTEKYIVNISSNVKILPETFFVVKEIIEYRDSKKKLDEVMDNYTGTIKILNVLPELTNTNFNLGIEGFDISSGMSSEYVADLIYKEFNTNNRELVIKHWQWLKHAN